MDNFTKIYNQRVKKFKSINDIKRDSKMRYLGSHNEPMLKYQCNSNFLKHGQFYTFSYNDNLMLDYVNKNEFLFYDKTPFVFTLNDYINYGLNLNAISHIDRLRLFELLYDYVKIVEVNGKKNPGNAQPLQLSINRINNILKLNHIPYIRYNPKYINNVVMFDSSEIINFADLIFDSIIFAKNMNYQKLNDKVKRTYIK